MSTTRGQVPSFDNTMAESFFSTIKRELIYRHPWTADTKPS